MPDQYSTLLRVFNALSEHVALIDDEGVIIEVNERWARFAAENGGDSQSRSLGENYIEICERASGQYAEEGPVVASALRRILAGELPEFSLEYPCHSAGERRWFILTARPLVFEGDIEGAVIAHMPITARKLAEEALTTSEARLRGILEHSPSAVFLKDASGRLLVANQRYAEYFGQGHETIVGKISYEVMPPALVERAKAEDRQVVETGLAVTAEYMVRFPDGPRSLHSVKFPVPRQGGGPPDIGGIVSDITLRKRAEQFREDVEHVLRHDLKTPLAAALGLPELILDEGGLNPTQKLYLQLIQEYGERMRRMIDASLDLFQIEQGTHCLETADLDMAAIARELWGDVRSAADQAGLRLRLVVRGLVEDPDRDKAEAGFVVPCHASLCRTMLANCIQNAVEASPPGGTITVAMSTIQENGGEAVIMVHNQGAVPHAIRERFFDKYVTAGKKRGTGLGTYSVLLAVRAHGGEIDMDTSEARGTTITIRLPLAPQSA